MRTIVIFILGMTFFHSSYSQETLQGVYSRYRQVEQGVDQLLQQPNNETLYNQTLSTAKWAGDVDMNYVVTHNTQGDIIKLEQYIASIMQKMQKVAQMRSGSGGNNLNNNSNNSNGLNNTQNIGGNISNNSNSISQLAQGMFNNVQNNIASIKNSIPQEKVEFKTDAGSSTPNLAVDKNAVKEKVISSDDVDLGSLVEPPVEKSSISESNTNTNTINTNYMTNNDNGISNTELGGFGELYKNEVLDVAKKEIIENSALPEVYKKGIEKYEEISSTITGLTDMAHGEISKEILPAYFSGTSNPIIKKIEQITGTQIINQANSAKDILNTMSDDNLSDEARYQILDRKTSPSGFYHTEEKNYSDESTETGNKKWSVHDYVRYGVLGGTAALGVAAAVGVTALAAPILIGVGAAAYYGFKYH